MSSILDTALQPNPRVQLACLMEAAGDAVFRVSVGGRIVYASKRATALVGRNGSLTGMALTEMVLPVDIATAVHTMKSAIESGGRSRVNVRLLVPQGIRWFELQVTSYVNEDADTELLIVGRDISDQQATEDHLRYLATHDALTALPNRALLSDRLQMTILQSRRTGRGFSVLALDLDGFKKINDALGHPVGDLLLVEAAQRLRKTVRNVDTLARVGGDEFIAVLPSALQDGDIDLVARRMISAIQLPFDIQGHTLYISTSIGAAIYPDHGDSDVKLLAHADTALYRAKETGKSCCVLYDPGTFTQPEHDVSLEAEMFEAVRNGEFLLHYQPIVDSVSRQVVGYEALMRWQHPEIGLVPPNEFIHMAEENGLINLLGAWALKAACVQVRSFEQAAGRPLYVAVNVSPRQFRNEQFLNTVDEALALSGLEGQQLLLEITEGILMSDPVRAEALLTAIAGRGVRIAIDDFGTGYSSLAYLKRFPINVLKIDRAFIKDLPQSVKDAAICNVVMSLAGHLNLTTVAEGVETEAQLDFLARQGCGLIQGYHTGRPVLPEEAVMLLRPEADRSSIAAS